MKRTVLSLYALATGALMSIAAHAAPPPAGVVFTQEASGNTLITLDWCWNRVFNVKGQVSQLGIDPSDLPEGIRPEHKLSDTNRKRIANELCQSLPDSQFKPIRHGSSVIIHVRSFNFVKFDLDLTVETTECIACEQLTGLWSGIFTLLGTPEGPARGKSNGEEDAFWRALLNWRQEVIDQNRVLSAVASKARYRREFLIAKKEKCETTDATKRHPIECDIEKVQALAKEVIAKREKTFSEVHSRDHYEVAVALESGAHNTFMAGAGKFIRLAKRSLGGQRKDVRTLVDDPIKRNTFITVTAASSNEGGEATGASANIDYFLHPRLPVRAHFGGAFSMLDDNTFETIRAGEEQDIFSQVRDEEGQQDLAAFLSYEWPIKRRPEAMAWQATLGTGFEEPGETIYAGVGLRFRKRFVLTLGLAFGKEVEGEEPAAIGLPDELKDVDGLYQTIRERSGEDFFFAISIAVN